MKFYIVCACAQIKRVREDTQIQKIAGVQCRVGRTELAWAGGEKHTPVSPPLWRRAWQLSVGEKMALCGILEA